MKKLIFTLLVVLVVLLALTACGRAGIASKCDTCTFGDWYVVSTPTCQAVGVQARACSVCGNAETSRLEKTTHTFSAWQVTRTPTCLAQGEQMRACAVCMLTETEALPKLETVYTITLNMGESTDRVLVDASGVYALTDPLRAGYNFMGWTDAVGEPFASTGTISANQTLTPVWEISETATFAQLKQRIENGADEILLVADILLTDTIHVVDQTVIYTKDDHSLIRSPDFYGDLFILGEDVNGGNVLLSGKSPVLTLRTENGAILTVDGNKDNMRGRVNGTAFFLVNSSILNLNDNVTVRDCQKFGNDRLLDDGHNFSDPARVGGAAVIVANGVFNMYGGLITGCEVNTKDSANTDKIAQVQGYNNSSCGGAVYNHGTMQMYGGVIENSVAARGGAIYNYRTARLYGGEIRENYASVYGGMMYQANSQYTYSVLGVAGTDIKLLISQNSSEKSGGAIFAPHQTTVYVQGGTMFRANKSLSGNGGAINMAGELVVDYAVFEENLAASKGGAIYAYYGESEHTPRIVDLRAGLFVGNEASRGGAISFAVAGDVTDRGAIGKIGAVTFRGNRAFMTEESSPTFIDNTERDGVTKTQHGNGGALHVSEKSSVTVSGAAVFEQNDAGDKGGAIYVTSSAVVTVAGTQVSPVSIKNNTAGGNGGAIYLYTTASVNLTHVDLQNNIAKSTSYGGGAIYMTGATAVLNSVKLEGNQAYRGGALTAYSGSTAILTNIYAYNNKATNNGGCIYISGSEVTVQSNGVDETLFIQNSAEGNGGAFAVHGKGVLNLYGIHAKKNTSDDKGGALYIYDGTVNLGDAQHTAINRFTGNSAVDGGAICVYAADGKESYLYAWNISAEENTAENGGAIYASVKKNAEGVVQLEINTLTLKDNVATDKGGALYIYLLAQMKIGTLNATGNSATQYGGVAYISGAAKVSINAIQASQNTASQGGAIYITTTNTTLTLYGGSILNNTAEDGGSAIWCNTKKAIVQIKSGALEYTEGSIEGASGFAVTEPPALSSY